MDVTVIGTGNMARGIGTRLVVGGHHVTVLGKEPGDAEAVVNELARKCSAGRASRSRTTSSSLRLLPRR
jgi:8-hydroxy-5-deazaflavin:NADPH oxidoreductase